LELAAEGLIVKESMNDELKTRKCGHPYNPRWDSEDNLCSSCKNSNGAERVSMRGGKRANIDASKYGENWWVGYGKDDSCQFEGPWEHLAVLAAKILRHPNTKIVAPNLYLPDLPITKEQEESY